MAARLQVISVQPLDNPSPVDRPVKVQITFEVYEHLPEDVDWELLFAWDGEEKHDIVLDSVSVGPMKPGRHQFVFEAPPLDYSKVKDEDITDVSVLFLRCTYREQLFTKVAFFVSHTYTDQELLQEPPAKPILEKLERRVHTSDIRVTHFPIKWTDSDTLMPPEESNADGVDEEEVDGGELLFTVRQPQQPDEPKSNETITVEQPLIDKTNN